MTTLDVKKLKTPEDILDAVSKLPPEVLAEAKGGNLTKEELMAFFKKHLMPSSSKTKKASEKAHSPESAKKMFDAYRKKHPSTEKKWQDFYEKKDSSGSESPKLSKEQKQATKAVTKALASPKVKKALAKDMHKEMDKLSKDVEKGAEKLKENKGFMDKVKGVALRNPTAANLAIYAATFATSTAAMVGGYMLWDKAKTKVVDAFHQSNNELNYDPENNNKERDRVRKDINSGEKHAEEIAQVGLVAGAVMAAAAASVASDKIMQQIYAEELRKPDGERDDEALKHMETVLPESVTKKLKGK